ncbi:unnamed protein product, partial [Rotaria sordida]
MKRSLEPDLDASCNPCVKRNKRGKIQIPLNEIITVVSKLGDQVTKLDGDGRWRSEDSLWSQLAADLACRLPINNCLGIRKYIYAMWHRPLSKLRSHFINQQLDNDNNNVNLQQLSSIPSYTKVCTRSKTAKASNDDVNMNESQQHLVEFSYEEWRNVYKKDGDSVTFHYMDPSWTDVFNDKLINCKLVTCNLAFTKSILRKKYSRKRNRPLFQCRGRCTELDCPLTVYMAMTKPVSVNHGVVFRVQINGTQQHNNESGPGRRPLKGEKRKKMAQAAIEHGTLKIYEKNVLNADEHLLQYNNYSQVPSLDVIKTAVKEQNNATCLDKDMFTELMMMLFSMRESDETSNLENKGYIQTLQVWPFGTIFYTESQLFRFIEYCLSAKNSYIYVDATGSVAKALPDQKKPYLYLICFKDGEDPSNLLPLAGALLTDHTTASITNWLSIVRHGIAVAKGRFIRPTYVIIDFSPAILNAILLAFNNTSINSYLRWCFNAIHKNYTFEQLSSVSCIRFCCAHVMHAFTRSLSKINIKKNIRRKATIIFATLLNCNELRQAYELIGCIMCIFGSVELSDSEQYLETIINAGGDFVSEFETFVEDENLNDAQRSIEQELAELDDNFLSSEPILHQSPFTKLARERSPILNTLIDKSRKLNETEIKNPLFSKELIKVFYKWIAYLPMFTGLIHQYQERYASDATNNAMANAFGHGRVSNAPIESFFKILKHSILRHQTNLRPGLLLLKMYSTINARLKAHKHNIQQSGSKKRSRSTKKQIDTTAFVEKWKNKGTKIESRGIYFNNLIELKLTASDIRSRLREKLEMRKTQSINDDNMESVPCVSITDTCEYCINLNQNIEPHSSMQPGEESNQNTDIMSTFNHHEVILGDFSTSQQTTTTPPRPSEKDNNINESAQTTLASPSDENQQILISTFNHHEIQLVDFSTSQPAANTPTRTSQQDNNINESAQTTPESSSHENQQILIPIEFHLPNGWPKYTIVGNLQLAFPHFNFGPTFFDGKRYSASNTCSLDSSLFLLYYIYKSSSNYFRSLFNQNLLVCEQLRKTFEFVETDGWDIARLYWITIHSTHPDKNNRVQHHDLYTTADNNVFQYVRELQKHVIKSTCRSSDCPKLERVKHSVDIAMPQLTGRNRRFMSISSFSEQYTTNCGATIGPNEPKSYNGSYSKDDYFPATDGNGTRTMFICESGRVVEPHKFVNNVPPILLLNVGQVKIDVEKNKAVAPSVKHLPFIIFIGKQRYRLAGAICPQAGHFTATIVHTRGQLSKYDDRCKVGV